LKKELPAKARTANGRIKIAGEYISGNAKLKM